MNALDRLRTYIIDVPAALNALSEQELTLNTPGKWSRKEILGHLIDSAINNLKRFTDAQFAEEPYPVQRYDQNKLVAVNHYQMLPLPHLLLLWGSLNTQIVYVIDNLPFEVLALPIQLPYSNQVNNTIEKLTLGWLFEDYVSHMEHHLKTLI
ncbi:DinB family protein [Spirosoma gilvum]